MSNMENQHRKISGYRELTAADIALMNEIKAHAAQGKVLADKVMAHVNAQFDATKQFISIEKEQELIDALPEDQRDVPSGMVQTDAAKAEWLRLVLAEPHRWVSISKTDMQTASMALARAVAQPTTF